MAVVQTIFVDDHRVGAAIGGPSRSLHTQPAESGASTRLAPGRSSAVTANAATGGLSTHATRQAHIDPTTRSTQKQTAVRQHTTIEIRLIQRVNASH